MEFDALEFDGYKRMAYAVFEQLIVDSRMRVLIRGRKKTYSALNYAKQELLVKKKAIYYLTNIDVLKNIKFYGIDIPYEEIVDRMRKEHNIVCYGSDIWREINDRYRRAVDYIDLCIMRVKMLSGIKSKMKKWMK